MILSLESSRRYPWPNLTQPGHCLFFNSDIKHDSQKDSFVPFIVPTLLYLFIEALEIPEAYVGDAQ